MTDHPDFLKDMAAHWRELAEVGDPARRAERERWAAALDQMAEQEVADRRRILSPEAEEKQS